MVRLLRLRHRRGAGFDTQFFPEFSPVAGVLASFATFAVGFLARPLGGIFAGHLGDKYGRKPVLVAALVLMGVATTVIGVLPSYAAIGVLAPIALASLRLLQGVAVGAQWGGAMLLVTEYAPANRRGLYSSVVQLGVPIGVVLANAVFLVVQSFPPSAVAWAWRMPFLVGVVILGLAWYLHAHVEETPEFRRATARTNSVPDNSVPDNSAPDNSVPDDSVGGTVRSPLLDVLRHRWITVVLAAASFTVNNATFYIVLTGCVEYGTSTLHMSSQALLAITMAVAVIAVAVIVASARLSDRIGRLRVYTAGAVGLLVWAVPMFLLIGTATYVAYAVAVLVAMTLLSVMYGPQAALFAELLPVRVRYTGASLGYQLSTVVGGGLAPFIMTALLAATGTAMSVSAYVIVLAAAALVAIAILVRRQRRTSSPPMTAEPAS